MKKLLTATLVLLVLAAFPGLSAAQEKKQAPDKPKGGQATLAGPPADRLTLTEITSLKPQQECRVIVRPCRTPCTGNNAWKYAGADVFFEKVPGSKPGVPPKPIKTDANGVRAVTVLGGQKIRAVYGTDQQPRPYALVSNEFTCSVKRGPADSSEKQ